MHAVSVPPLAGAAGGDTATNERLRMLGMTRRFPHPLRMSLPLPSVVLVVVHALQRDPQQRGNFFWMPMIVSACVSFLWSRRVSRSNSAMRVSRTSFGGAFGPRFTDPVPANAPAAPCRRQVLRLDEYNPSRRNKAPTSPTFLHLSASLTIRRLYSPLNRRRVAFSATSGSGPSPVRPAAPRATPVALRAPSVARDASFSSSLITHTGYRPSRPAH